MPKVSVIIPSYNCARFVASAVESALAQTFRDFEVIVVNDGSTDETEAVLSPFQGRIVYIHQENCGLPGARNRGIAAARGELIALLDADDRWLPDKLEAQVGAFAPADVGLVYSDIRVDFDEGGVKEPSYLAALPADRREGLLLDVVLRSPCFICPSTAVLRRSMLERVGGFDAAMRYFEDADLWLRLGRHCRAVLVPRVLAVKLQRVGNMSRNVDRMTEFEIRVWRRALREAGFDARQRAEARRELARVYEQRAWWLVKSGRAREARSLFARRLGQDPRNPTAWRQWVTSFVPVRLRPKTRADVQAKAALSGRD